MHTIIMFSAGIILLPALWAFGKKQHKMNTAMTIYMFLWFIICAINMCVGVIKAGYTFMEELPIFLLLFGIPALMAVFFIWSAKK